ncbi:MAG: hypothetical protein ACYC6N_27910 [Pirellulaceae bacterium]
MNRPLQATVRSYSTGGVIVSHNTADEGRYYNTPSCEVAYALSVMRTADSKYVTIYHSEPKKTACRRYPGDSIKTAIEPGAFEYVMPAERDFRFYNHLTDTLSVLYSPEAHGPEGWGGAGNPMVVKGAGEDPFYYMFFVAVTDDDRDRDLGEADFRHYLCQGRSLNMRDWELRTEPPGPGPAWKPFRADSPAEERRPFLLKDSTGQAIHSHVAAKVESTQGLPGSICRSQDIYYFFYTCPDPDGNTYLFVRTLAAKDVGQGLWSAAKRVSSEPLMDGTLVKVAKAHDMDKWAVFYNGYKEVGGKLLGDLMLQYTENATVIGPGGISALHFYDYWKEGLAVSLDKYLGLASGATQGAQFYFMIDEYGNLAVPSQEDQSYRRGGMAFWTSFTGSVYGDDVYRAGWDVLK